MHLTDERDFKKYQEYGFSPNESEARSKNVIGVGMQDSTDDTSLRIIEADSRKSKVMYIYIYMCI